MVYFPLYYPGAATPTRTRKVSPLRLRLPRLAYNKITLSGAFLALVAAIMMAFFLLFRSQSHDANPYLGILVYMVLPPILVLGLLIIPLGMFRQKKIIERGGTEMPQWPMVDLGNPTHRNAFTVFVVGTIFFVLLSVVGGYQAFHFTESVEFCGTTCHEVMKPEHVAYQASPHARVPCVKCHVGPGAGWYARSKLSGAYQVYATARNIYPRPIPTPIHNLRPAKDVCEQCHWPQKFFGDQQKAFDHYMYDDENTHWPILMTLKTGGGNLTGDDATGIHWHMNISATVEYIARDHERQEIPWVRVTDLNTGKVNVYQDEEDPLSEEEIAAAEPRTMDCVDCHNRPSHNYHSPDFLVDRVIHAGHVNAVLPEIKRVAVELMSDDYETEDEALSAIDSGLREFYEENYPDVLEDHAAALGNAIAAVQMEFSRNMFPEMKVRWSEYPDNIGHFIFPGCMRCHNGNHVSEEGRVISHDCSTCHTINAQGKEGLYQVASSLQGLEFLHPDGDDDWRDTACHECHEGVEP